MNRVESVDVQYRNEREASGENAVTRFLIVESQEFFRIGIKTFIHRHRGWQVVGEAVSVRESVELCQKLRPNIVILEFPLPDPEDPEAVQTLIAGSPGLSLLMLSAHRDEATVNAALAAGARGYVLKASPARELTEAIHAAVAGEFYFSPAISDLIIRTYASKAGLPASREVSLSARELEVLQLLADGKNTKEVAVQLRISARTVEGHRSHVMKKLNARSFSELVRYAIRSGICH